MVGGPLQIGDGGFTPLHQQAFLGEEKPSPAHCREKEESWNQNEYERFLPQGFYSKFHHPDVEYLTDCFLVFLQENNLSKVYSPQGDGKMKPLVGGVKNSPELMRNPG
jgi:hypothetical protein